MKKPRYTLSFLKLLTGVMGVILLLFTREKAIAVMLLIFSLIFFALSLKKKELEEDILLFGLVEKGKILKIKKLFFLQFNGQSPYVIYYSYKHKGTNYTGKSNLVWDTQNFYEQQAIDVYVDTYDPENSLVLF